MKEDALHDLVAFRPRDRHEALTASELALGGQVGSCLIVGDPPPALILGIAASASSVTVIGTNRQFREARRLIEGLTPCAVDAAPEDGEGLPLLTDVYGSALVFGLPRKDPEEVLERTLTAVADGGAIYVSLPRRGGSDARLERLVKALCSGEIARPSHAPLGRLVLFGRRKAPVPLELTSEVPGQLPVSVIITTAGRPEMLEEVLCDVLLRQHLPPLEVFVMDDAKPSERSVPENLFGLPARASVRTILVPTGGVGLASAVNNALGGVQGSYVAILEDDDRIAPNHLAAMGLALEHHETWVAVASDTVLFDERGAITNYRPSAPLDVDRPLRSLLEGCPFLPPSALYRTDALREIQGLDPALSRLQHYDLWFRLVGRGPIGLLPLALGGVRRPASPPAPNRAQRLEESARAILLGFRERVSATRLAQEFPEVPKAERESMALVARGKSLLRVDAFDPAHDDFRSALERVPGFAPAEEGLLLYYRRSGRHDQALAEAERYASKRSRDPAGHLAVANAFAALGKRDGGLQRLDGLLAGFPDLEVAHLNRLGMLLAGGDVRGEAALRAYLARRRDVRTLPFADHLLIAPRQVIDQYGV